MDIRNPATKATFIHETEIKQEKDFLGGLERIFLRSGERILLLAGERIFLRSNTNWEAAEFFLETVTRLESAGHTFPTFLAGTERENVIVRLPAILPKRRITLALENFRESTRKTRGAAAFYPRWI